MNKADSIIRIFPQYLRPILSACIKNSDALQEIRLRCGAPLTIIENGKEFFIDEKGLKRTERNGAFSVSLEDIEACLNLVCTYSLYAYDEEIKQGFITVAGGHRVGICGQAVTANGAVINLRYISALNIRIAHEVQNAAYHILPQVYHDRRPLNCLIASPPGLGKTTILRDLVRLASDGNYCGEGVCVGLVDERGEIAGSYMGIAGNYVGTRTDILDACPKALGMMMLIRSMNPTVIAVDEICDGNDTKALLNAALSGAKIFATIHANGMGDIRRKVFMQKVLDEQLIDRFIILVKGEKFGRVGAIYDQNFNRLQ